MKVESLTITVPAYNEESSLEKAVESIIISAKRAIGKYEIIVVNDGSQDQTQVVLDSLVKKYPEVKAIHHSQNRMIGAAFLSALSRSNFSHILLMPVDNPLSSEKLQEFIETARHSDIVVGVRPERIGYKSWMRILAKIYRLFCTALFKIRLRDLTWICLYDRKKITDLSLRFHGIALFPEVLIKAFHRNLKIVEIECPMTARRVGKPTVGKISRIGHLFFETLHLWVHIHFGKW